MMRFNLFRFSSLVFAGAILSSACSVSKDPATPVETFKTYVKAFKQKDITTMKLLLSSDTIKMHEQEAKAEGVTLDDIVKRETLIGEGQTKFEYRNEKIEDDTATLEYKNSYGLWETIPFVRENGEWKIDKRSYLDQMMKDVEQNGEQFDEQINRGRQPY